MIFKEMKIVDLVLDRLTNVNYNEVNECSLSFISIFLRSVYGYKEQNFRSFVSAICTKRI